MSSTHLELRLLRLPVTWVFAGLAFVAALVVAGESSHQLLIVRPDLIEELASSFASKLGGFLPVVGDDDVAVLALNPLEPLGTSHQAHASSGEVAQEGSGARR